MFFDSAEQIRDIAVKTGAVLFVVPDSVAVEIPGAIVIEPDKKSTITIEQMRELMVKLELRQTNDLFVIIRPAEKMGLEAANAFLKCLEEPGEKVHFVLVTSEPSALLPTILSRTAVYFLRMIDDGQIHADEKMKGVAKRLMVAKPGELLAVAEEIAKKKDRAYALTVVGLAVEMLYKSYYITGKEVFLARLPKFLNLYDNLSRNGHVKLQIVASLI